MNDDRTQLDRLDPWPSGELREPQLPRPPGEPYRPRPSEWDTRGHVVDSVAWNYMTYRQRDRPAVARWLQAEGRTPRTRPRRLTPEP